jgi:predicted DNA-binding protein (MmcQ/YjbR family)
MNIESLREYCLRKKNVTEEFPFGDSTLVFKVMGKIFLLASLDSSPLQFNVKSDPDKALEMRETYDSVRPGYHMNKKHWNTILADGNIPVKKIRELIDDSYTLVVKSLPKKNQSGLL